MVEHVVVGLLVCLSGFRGIVGINSSDSGSGVGNVTDSEPGNRSIIWTRPVAISGGTAAIGLFIVLALMAVVIACKYRYQRRRRLFRSQRPKRRATTFRARKLTKAQNGSTTIVNKAHNYEAVLPNFSSKVKEPPKAQNYEVPLSQSGTLQHRTADSELQHSLTVKETSSEDKSANSSLDGPVYMNFQQACHPSQSLQCMDSLKESVENLSYVGCNIIAPDKSWEV